MTLGYGLPPSRIPAARDLYLGVGAVRVKEVSNLSVQTKAARKRMATLEEASDVLLAEFGAYQRGG